MMHPTITYVVCRALLVSAVLFAAVAVAAMFVGCGAPCPQPAPIVTPLR